MTTNWASSSVSALLAGEGVDAGVELGDAALDVVHVLDAEILHVFEQLFEAVELGQEREELLLVAVGIGVARWHGYEVAVRTTKAIRVTRPNSTRSRVRSVARCVRARRTPATR